MDNKDQNIDDIQTLKAVVNNLEKRLSEFEKQLEIAGRQEYANLIIESKTDQLFQRAYKKLLFWLSPFFFAFLILGFNLYDSNKKVYELRQSAERSIKEFDILFKDEQKLRILKMLLANFYSVKSIRIPLGLTFQDYTDKKNYDGIFTDAKVERVSVTLLTEKEPASDYEYGKDVITGTVDYEEFSDGLTLSNFYPSFQVEMKALEKIKYLHVQCSIRLKMGTAVVATDSLKLFTYTGYIESGTLVNGVNVFNDWKKEENVYTDPFFRPKYEFSIVNNKGEGSFLRFEVFYDISSLMHNIVSRYESKHSRSME